MGRSGKNSKAGEGLRWGGGEGDDGGCREGCSGASRIIIQYNNSRGKKRWRERSEEPRERECQCEREKPRDARDLSRRGREFDHESLCALAVASDPPANVGLVLLNARKECTLAQPVDSLETFLKVAELGAVGSGAAIALIGLEDVGLSVFSDRVELFFRSDLVHRVPDAVENVADGDTFGVLDDDAPASVAGDELNAALEGLSGRDVEVFSEWECGAVC